MTRGDGGLKPLAWLGTCASWGHPMQVLSWLFELYLGYFALVLAIGLLLAAGWLAGRAIRRRRR